MIDSWYVTDVINEIIKGCHRAGCGEFQTTVTIEKDGVSFSVPVYVPEKPRCSIMETVEELQQCYRDNKP